MYVINFRAYALCFPFTSLLTSFSSELYICSLYNISFSLNHIPAFQHLLDLLKINLVLQCVIPYSWLPGSLLEVSIVWWCLHHLSHSLSHFLHSMKIYVFVSWFSTRCPKMSASQCSSLVDLANHVFPLLVEWTFHGASKWVVLWPWETKI